MLIISSKRRRRSTWVIAILGLIIVLGGGFAWLTSIINDAPAATLQSDPLVLISSGPTIAMSEKEGTLRMMASGRWAVCRPGREPVEITSGELFCVEVDGELQLTRMESTANGRYYTIDGYPLRDGLRAAIGEHG
jgi:hypothetical protein